jgi:hypothetical protein
MKGKAFVKLPRDLLESDAWRSLSINARRLVDTLMLEHMRHGGKRNGFLVAPRRQLERAEIHAHLVSGAIDDAQRVGIIDCKRGIGRRPSYYALTWLPLSDGTEPSNRWRHCAAEAADAIAARKLAKTRHRPPIATEQSAVTKKRLHFAQTMTKQSAVTKPVATCQSAVTIGGTKVQSPSRSSYQGGEAASVLEGKGSQQEVWAPAAEAPDGNGAAAPETDPGKPDDADPPPWSVTI